MCVCRFDMYVSKLVYVYTDMCVYYFTSRYCRRKCYPEDAKLKVNKSKFEILYLLVCVDLYLYTCMYIDVYIRMYI